MKSEDLKSSNIFFDNSYNIINNNQTIIGYRREKYNTFITPLINDETIYRIYYDINHVAI
jgi:hypothetical protein